jgi:pyruvate/2-oxoglutarate/acetoin dehydrogenase E1 component
MSERVVENLNRSIQAQMAADDAIFFLGEDILDPYGGAFKVSRGLSTAFPDRVISTPISENGIVGVANGLALAGQKAIVELMFGDFIFLAYDQIINFASKSVTMFGDQQKFHLMIRCPVGGNRGYGATHSQSVQKHFIGIPNLDLYEMSPLHDNCEVLPRLINSGRPCIFFENKVLYAQSQYSGGRVDELFSYDFIDEAKVWARACITPEVRDGIIIITVGGMFNSCLQAARQMFLDSEIETQILVPSKLYPLDVSSLGNLISDARVVYVVEEGTAGGTWGNELAITLASHFPKLKTPIRFIHSKNSIIPSARHLEREVLVQPETIINRITDDLTHASRHDTDHQ